MSSRSHIIGLTLCGVLVAAFQYLALVWSFADFHPGYIQDLPEHLLRRARIGRAMFLPFDWPLRWLQYGTGGNSAFVGIVQWLILPLCDGAVFYFAFAFLRRRVSSRDSRNV